MSDEVYRVTLYIKKNSAQEEWLKSSSTISDSKADAESSRNAFEYSYSYFKSRGIVYDFKLLTQTCKIPEEAWHN